MLKFVLPQLKGRIVNSGPSEYTKFEDSSSLIPFEIYLAHKIFKFHFQGDTTQKGHNSDIKIWSNIFS